MSLRQSDLDDLATIDVDDAFLQRNLDTRFDAHTSQTTLQDVCTAFVRTFLIDRGDWISSLHVSLRECVTVLEGMETVLEKFIEQLERIQHDIGEVRETLAKTSIELGNAKMTERVLWAAIAHLVVPPEMVQIVTQTNDGELGMLFQLTLKELLKYLNYRKGVWQQPTIAPATATQHSSAPRTSSAAAAAASRQRHVRELRLPLTEFQIYSELLTVLDSLTVFACIKVRDFLTRKLQVLTIANTNVCIQQENNLKQFSFFVHFLRSAPPLLRHAHARGVQGGQQPTLVPYRITRAIYNEFKQHYCLIMSTLYLRKIQDYVLTLNAMEYSTTASASFGSVSSTLLGGFTRVQPAAPSTVYKLPPVTEPQGRAGGGGGGASPASVFALGSRGEIFGRVFAAPLIPTLEKAAGRRHSYEETLRSLLRLLVDTVTHEYLFTFEFFSGDTSVYVDVFQPTLQFIVDYLSEVVLTQLSGSVRQLLNQRPGSSVNVQAKDDTYGLLILIRLCHEYRFYMKTVRKLSCLDTFFDSLLVLLWPAFKRTFDAQLVALRCAQVPTLAAVTAHLRTTAERVATVHPLVRNYSAMSCALLSVALGAALAEEKMVSEEVGVAKQRTSKRSSAASSRSASTSSSASSSTSTASVSRSSASLPFSGASPLASPPLPLTHRGDETSLLDSSYTADGSTPHTNNASASAAREGGSGAAHDYAAVRRRAMEMMAVEDEADAAESRDRFVALVGNVDFVRVQVIHYAEEVVKYILLQGNVRQPAGSALTGKAGMMRDAYVVNQLHFMWTAAQACVFPGEERHVVTLTERFDVAQLREMYDTYRARLQEEILDVYFPEFIHVARSEEDVPAPPLLVKVADQFLLTWKAALDALRSEVTSLVYDAQLANEVVAQVCMEVLLCNTRFLKIMSSAVESHPAVFTQRPIRTLIVSNQNILQHMRNYSMHIDTSAF